MRLVGFRCAYGTMTGWVPIRTNQLRIYTAGRLEGAIPCINGNCIRLAEEAITKGNNMGYHKS